MADPALPSIGEAVAHQAAGRLDAAEAIYRRILAVRPDHPDALHLLGVAALQRGDFANAVDLISRAVRVRPDDPAFHANLGTARLESGDIDGAIAALRTALSHDPDHADALFNLGNALRRQGNADEARAQFERVVALQPESMDAHLILADVMRSLGRLDDAVAVCRKAVAIDDFHPPAHNNLGNALTAVGRRDEAMAHFRRAVALRPDYADAYNNMAEALKEDGRLGDAIDAYESALATDPGHREARFGRALARLLGGDFEAGWDDYRARESMAGRDDGFHRRTLQGDLAGTRLLIERDQGLGDEIFFLRFVPALRARGPWIACLPDPRLTAMFERCGLFDAVIGDGDAPPAFDLHLSIGDLPYLLGADGTDVPPPVALPVLAAADEAVRERLAGLGPPPYTGVTWRAGTAARDRVLFKEAPIEGIAGALGDTGGTVVALQRAPAAGEVAAFARSLGRPVGDLTALNDDLEAMLALCGALDAYVCVSNTNVHLRAARGGACHVLAPNPPEFRWMADGAESPWFPATRIYRQATNGDWSDALAALGRDLAAAPER